MTERFLPNYFPAAIEDPVVFPQLLYEGIFVSALGAEQALRLWTGAGDLLYGGVTWTGRGNLLGCSPIEEASDPRAVGFSISLSGQNPELVSLALSATQRSQGRAGKIWLALFNEAGQMLDQPLLLKRGRLDVAMAKDAGDQAVISVQYEDRLVDLRRPRLRQYSGQDHKRDFPEDLGFDYVPSLQDADIVWQ